MTAVFTDFDSSMASRIVVDSEAKYVDVTFRSSGTTYRFNLNDADISDIMSVLATRSKGRLLHQLLDIRNGVRVADETNVAVPKVSNKPVQKTLNLKNTANKIQKQTTAPRSQKKVATR